MSYCVIHPAMTRDQDLIDAEESEAGRQSVVYMSTYNCDLSPSVCPPGNLKTRHPTSCSYTNRREAQIRKMEENEDSEVLCLQGVWYARDLEAIVRKTAFNFQYSYSFLHDNSGHFNASQKLHPPCDEQDAIILKSINECEFKECHYSSERTKIFKCIEDICKIKNILQVMSETCLGCIFQGTEEDNFEECTKSTYAFNPTGLLLLSKYSLLNHQRGLYHPIKTFDKAGREKSSEIVQRGYLDVEVHHIGRVVCTHLTEKFGDDYVEVGNTFKSYEKKNFFEFEALYTRLQNVPKVIILGDLNASPAITKGSIASQFSGNLEVLRDFGYQDPVSDSFKHREADCSYCCGNALVRKPDIGVCSKTSSAVGYIFDHVMVKGFDVFDTQEDYLKNNAAFRIFLTDDAFSAMSRHYGFTVPVIVK